MTAHANRRTAHAKRLLGAGGRTAHAKRLLGAGGAGLVLATAAAAAPAAAAPTHVGIVVRFANGSSQTACTTASGTGLAVLERTFTVQLGQAPPYAGFVFTINGQGGTRPDATHYWSYWHSSGAGGWAYGSSGAGSYTPEAGTVEGWSLVDGSGTAPPPPSVTYAAVCGESDPRPVPTPTRRPTHSPTAPARHQSTATPAPRPTRSRTSSHATPAGLTPIEPTPTEPTTSGAPVHSPPGTGQPSASTPHTASGAPSAADSTHPATAGARTTDATDPAAAIGVARPGSASADGGASITAAHGPWSKSAAGLPAWGTTLALATVLGIGATAWLRSRRRPE